MTINKLVVTVIFLCFFMMVCGNCLAIDCSSNRKMFNILEKYAETKININKVNNEVLRQFNMAIHNQSLNKKELICLLQYDFDWETNAFIMESLTKHPEIVLNDLNNLNDIACKDSKYVMFCDANLTNKLTLVKEAVSFEAILCVDYSDCALNFQQYKKAISFEILNMRRKNIPDREFVNNIEILLDNLVSYSRNK